MLIEEARALQPGDVLLTTDGTKVTFVEMGTTSRTAGGKRARTFHAAVVEFDDGRREAIPPRSLHKGRTRQ